MASKFVGERCSKSRVDYERRPFEIVIETELRHFVRVPATQRALLQLWANPMMDPLEFLQALGMGFEFDDGQGDDGGVYLRLARAEAIFGKLDPTVWTEDEWRTFVAYIGVTYRPSLGDHPSTGRECDYKSLHEVRTVSFCFPG